MLQRENQTFWSHGINKNRGKFRGDVGKISEILKIREKVPRKFPENFPENSRKTQSMF